MRLAPYVLVVFLVGLVAGPLLDQIHVRSGALSYAHPWFWDQAWWVGPQFGLAFAFLAAVAVGVQHHLGTRTPPMVPFERIVQQFAWFVGAYAATGLLWREPVLLCALLVGALAVRVASVRPDAPSRRAIVLLALVGTAYEGTLSSLPGTFSYAETHGLPVPVWLPLLYAHGAPILRTFMRNAVAAANAQRSA
jgi:hypothetical protein